MDCNTNNYIKRIKQGFACGILLWSAANGYCLPPLVEGGAAALITCLSNEAVQKERSKELQQLVLADQKEREAWFNKAPDEMQLMRHNDLNRRKRVGRGVSTP